MRNTILGTLLAFLLSAVFSTQVFAQDKITGTVSDAVGALPGVNVMIKGTSTGTTTGDNGEYSISASEGQVLVFSFIGYSDVEKTVGTQTRIDVVMSEDSQQLEALVVVGYGMQRRKDITGSVASVNMEDMDYTPGSDPVDMLRGRIAGVEVTSSSGRPGSSASIKVRGDRSLTGGNAPM